MKQTKPSLYDSFTYFIATVFFLILFFGHTLKYFNSPEISSGFILDLVDMIYSLKRTLLLLSVVAVFFRSKISLPALATVVIVITLVLYTYINLSRTMQFNLFTDVYLDLFCGIAFFLLLVSGVVQIDRFMPVAIFLGRFLLIGCLISIFVQDDLDYFVSAHYMFISNAFLVPIAVLIYAIYQKNYLWDYLLVTAGMLAVLLYGSRGDFLVLSVLAIIMLYLKIKKKSILLLLLTIPALISAFFAFINSGIVSFNNSRTVEKIFSGEFFESAERFDIWAYLLSKSVSNFLMGRGFCADRLYLLEIYKNAKQVYAHNFFVEVLVDFGLVGLIAAIAAIVILLKFLAKCTDCKKKEATIVLLCVAFIPLMFSRSFLTEPGFFMMLGVVLNWQVTYKHKGEGFVNEKSIRNYSNVQERRNFTSCY